jgi:putative membrane protein
MRMRRTLLLAATVVLGISLTSPSGAQQPGQTKPQLASDFKSLTPQQFVMMASASGLAEVNLSRLAQERAASAEVKQFAQHMVQDHTKANMQLLQLANTEKIPPAQRMDDKHQMLFERLSQLKGQEFDREFMKAMLHDHEQAVALFSAAEKNLTDKNLQAFAARTLPTLKEHLQEARKVAGSVGVQGAGGKGTEKKER